MNHLPIHSKQYSSDQVEGANVTFTYWFEPQEKKTAQNKGGIGLFVSLMGPDDFSGERATKFIWDSFQETYYDFAGETGDSVRAGVKAAQRRLVELIQNEPSVSDQGVDLHLCAFAIVDGEIHVTLIGEPGVVLARGDRIISISDMLPAYTGAGYNEEIPVGAFPLEKGDILLLSTPKLLDSLLNVLDAGNITVSDWNSATAEIQTFAENLVGNQYLWMVGYDLTIPEPSESVAVAEGLKGGTDRDNTEGMAGKGDTSPGEQDVRDKGLVSKSPGGVDGESSLESKPPYTLGGIKGVLEKVKDFLSTTVEKVKQGGFQEKAKNTLSTVKSEEFRSSTVRKARSFVTNFKVGNLRQKRMVVGKKSTLLSPKLIIILAVVFVGAILTISSIRQKNEERINQEITDILTEVTSKAESAMDIWQSEGDRSEVESTLASGADLLSQLDSYELSQEQGEAYEDLEDDIQQVYDTMNKVSPLSEELATIDILTDLYIKIGEDANVVDMEKYGSALYLVDQGEHVIYRYSPSEDIIEKVANSEEVLKSPRNIAIGEGYMFVYDEEVGVVTLDMNENRPDWVFRVRPELSARTIGAVTEIDAFRDNVYLLKSDEARVLKSYPAGAGFSYPEEYFRQGSFDKAVDILIDGNIYILTNANEKIFRFFAGQQDPFSLSGFPEPLGNLCCGDTNVNDTSKLYVYDVDGERIVSIEKPTSERHPGTGVMVRQYVYRGDREDIFKDVKEIIVDVDERVLYVLDGTRILQVLLENE